MSTVTIPAKYRAAVYTVFGILGLLIGATQIGFAAANAGQPTWLTVALAVYPFLGGGLGYTALTHTPSAEAEPKRARYDDEG